MNKRSAVSVLVVVTVTAVILAVPASSYAARTDYRCGKWKTVGATIQRYCANITSLSSSFSQAWMTSIHNKQSVPASMTCINSVDKTWRENVSVTVEAEAGVIFAKAKTSGTAGIEHSSTVTRGTSTTIRVKARSWAYCKYGTYRYSITGKSYKETRSSNGTIVSAKKTYTAKYPSRPAWIVGNGRG